MFRYCSVDEAISTSTYVTQIVGTILTPGDRAESKMDKNALEKSVRLLIVSHFQQSPPPWLTGQLIQSGNDGKDREVSYPPRDPRSQHRGEYRSFYITHVFTHLTGSWDSPRPFPIAHTYMLGRFFLVAIAYVFPPIARC